MGGTAPGGERLCIVSPYRPTGVRGPGQTVTDWQPARPPTGVRGPGRTITDRQPARPPTGVGTKTPTSLYPNAWDR
jgi:hypothetical protein